MNLDLRLPMGMMFSILGAVLLSFGLATRARPELYAKSFGINANLWMGVSLLIVGLIVVGMGRRGQGRIEQQRNGQGQIAVKKTKRR